MKLTIDTDNKRFVVTRAPEAKTDSTGQHRADKATGELLWVTQVAVRDDSGGDVINVTTRGPDAPDVNVDDEVDVADLVAIPWHTNGRNGIAYTATDLWALEP